MRPNLESVLASARTLPLEELAAFVGSLEEIKVTALLRISAPAPVQHSAERNLPEVLDVDQAAEYLNMSAKWIYRHSDILPVIRVGFGRRPRLKFRRRDLDAWLAKHRVESQ